MTRACIRRGAGKGRKQAVSPNIIDISMIITYGKSVMIKDTPKQPVTGNP